MSFKKEIDQGLTRGDKTYFLLWGVAIATLFIWNLPLIRWVQYPFMLLGTWFHEMGHGLTALLVGAGFEELVIFGNGSGYARISYSDMWINEQVGNVLIGLGGLLGPAIAGGVLVICGRQKKWSAIGLLSLSGFIFLTLAIWVRSVWGIIFMTVVGLSLIYVWWRGSRRTQQIVIQYLGIQASLSTFLQISYLFTHTVTVGGEPGLSDTARIAENSFGNYSLWGIIVTVITIGIIWYSFKLATSERLMIEKKWKS